MTTLYLERVADTLRRMCSYCPGATKGCLAVGRQDSCIEKAKAMTPLQDPEVESEEVKRIRSLKTAMRTGKIVLPSFPGIRQEMFEMAAPWTPTSPWTTHTEKVTDLAGGPLTPEMISNAMRDTQGKPDQDELVQAAYDMQSKVRESVAYVSVHRRTLSRIRDEAVRKGQPVSLQTEEFMLPIGINVIADPNMSPGAWKVVSEHHVYDSDQGLMHRYAGKCPRCSETIEMVFPIESDESGRAGVAEANREHAQFMERLRMKVKANYIENKGILKDFVKFVMGQGTCLVEPDKLDALIQAFLEGIEK